MKQRKRVGPAAMCAIGVGCVSACLTDACVWGGEIQGPGLVVCWGVNSYGQCNVPWEVGTVRAVAAGGGCTSAIRYDGTVYCWGYNGHGQCSVPSGLGTISAIDAGIAHTVVVKDDGTVACWGRNEYDQCSVPDGLGAVSAIGRGGCRAGA